MQRTRLKDIAEKVGCSIAVVSHVVNNASGNISCRQELRERILRTAKALDYAPRDASRALRSPHTFTIGVCITPREGDVGDDPDARAILGGVARVCRDKAYDLLVICSGLGGSDGEVVNQINARRVDGLVLLNLEDSDSWALPLAATARNVVAVDYEGDAALDAINFDDAAAGAMAAAELHRLGHRRIAYAGPMNRVGGRRAKARLSGFLATCRDLGVAAEPKTVFDETFPGSLPLPRGTVPEPEIAAQIAAAIKAMPARTRPTALVGASDACAMLAMHALQRAGIAVPRQISVVGIDDDESCSCTMPRLSSVRRPLGNMGEEAARYIVQQAERRRAVGNALLAKEGRWLRRAQPTFIARESTLALSP